MVRRIAVASSVVGLAFWALAVTRLPFPSAIASAQSQPSKVDFGRDVQPIFQQHCVGCHGPAQQMNGLRLDRRRDAMRGGSAGGVVIRPGNGEISALYLKLSGTSFGAQMPPTGALKPEQIAAIKQWIDQGAEWPDALAGDVEPAPADPAAERLIDAVRSRAPGRLASALKADAAGINKRGDGGSTPLMWAAAEHDIDAVRALIAAGADVKAKNDAGATALMWAIPDRPIVSLLVERGADVNVKTTDGRTPLLRAAGIYGAADLVRTLLDAGADPKAKGVSLFGQNTALTEAAYAGDADTIKLLLARGVDATVDGPAPMYFALRAGCVPCEEALIDATPLSLLSAAAMIHAPPGGDARHLKRLIDRGIERHPPRSRRPHAADAGGQRRRTAGGRRRGADCEGQRPARGIERWTCRDRLRAAAGPDAGASGIDEGRGPIRRGTDGGASRGPRGFSARRGPAQPPVVAAQR